MADTATGRYPQALNRVLNLIIEEYVKASFQSFVTDPPDSEYALGFLGAMLVVAGEALGLRMDIPPFAKAHQLWKDG